jgi:hypothetical protein
MNLLDPATPAKWTCRLEWRKVGNVRDATPA